jgi:hypothetical protein
VSITSVISAPISQLPSVSSYAPRAMIYTTSGATETTRVDIADTDDSITNVATTNVNTNTHYRQHSVVAGVNPRTQQRVISRELGTKRKRSVIHVISF